MVGTVVQICLQNLVHYSKYLCSFKLDHAEYLFYANTRLYYHSLRNWHSLDVSRWTKKFVFAEMISRRTSRSFCQLKASQMVPLVRFLKLFSPILFIRKLSWLPFIHLHLIFQSCIRLRWLSCKGKILMQRRILDS